MPPPATGSQRPALDMPALGRAAAATDDAKPLLLTAAASASSRKRAAPNVPKSDLAGAHPKAIKTAAQCAGSRLEPKMPYLISHPVPAVLMV